MSDDTGSDSVKPDELIRKAQAGDSIALDELFARYDRYLRLVISSSMGPALRREHDVSDVLQETLLAATTRFEKFHGDDERELVAWLRSLATRKIIDLARRMKRLKRAPSSQVSLDQQAMGSSYAEQLEGDLTSPSQGAFRKEMAIKLADALTQIDPQEAEVLWLKHVEGMTFEAIGGRIGVGRNGVRGIWTRGLKSLRKIMPDAL